MSGTTVKEGQSPGKRSALEFIQLGTSDNTRKAYKSDIKHFEEVWGGLLPASVESVCDYLAHYADELAVSTLTRRLTSISIWHTSQGFSDPRDDGAIKKTMKGIRKEYNRPPNQVKALSYNDLSLLVSHLENKINSVADEGIVTAQLEQTWLKANRDLAMLLVGFWRGFRADTICKLRLEHIKTETMLIDDENVEVLRIFIPASKGDREARGESFILPAMPELCPVTAYKNWTLAADLKKKKGVVFRKFDRYGAVTNKSIKPGTLCHWMKRMCAAAGLESPDKYGSHSMRRGIANLLDQKGADAKTLQDYVGWKTLQNAMRYLDDSDQGIKLLRG